MYAYFSYNQRIKALLEKTGSSDQVKEKAEAETLEFLKEKIIAATLRAPTAGNMMLICGAGLLSSRVSTKKKCRGTWLYEKSRGLNNNLGVENGIRRLHS